MELQAVTGLLYIVDGDVKDTSAVPGLFAQSAGAKAARGRESDFLFAHLTLSGNPEEWSPLARGLLEAIKHSFFRAPGSVTAALRKAILEANNLLLRHNLNQAGPTYEGALTCAVLHGDELFIAQAGETLALIGRNFGIERFPQKKPSAVTPMGRTAGLDMLYYHNRLQAGELLLLADPRLDYLPTNELEPAFRDVAVEDGLKTITQMVGSDSGRFILVEFTDEAPGHIPDAVAPLTVAAAGQQLAPPTRQPVRNLPEANRVDQPPAASKAVPAVDVEVVETTARQATSKAVRGLSLTTGWLADILTRLRPPRQKEGQSMGWALPTLLAIVIPLITAVVVTGVYVQRGRVVRVGEVKQAMQQHLVLAEQALDDPETAIQHYDEVLSLAAEGELLRPGDDGLQRMRLDAMKGLDEIAGVARLTGELLYQYEEGDFVASLELGDELNGNIYVMDSANNRVYRHDTEEDYQNFDSAEPEVILFGEQAVGSHIVGGIIDLMWRPRGNAVTRDGLAMLDTRGALISFYPNFSDTRAVPLGLASDWIQPESITSFNERLYILDSGANNIWRYFADGDGFTVGEDRRTVDFSDDVDLDQVVDFAIYSEDGSVILLYGDGRLRRYANGRLLWSEVEFASSGLKEPLNSPSAVKIVGTGLNSSIFILDPGSGRVVQFSLGGTYLAQFKVADLAGQELFARATDIAVAENPLRIYVVTADALHLASQG
jgi:sugar lactone lactonase YvrE